MVFTRKLWYNMVDYAPEGQLVRQVLGPLMRLDVRNNWSLIRLGPAWAALCGAVASGRLALSGQSLLFLLMVLFLADPLWGTLWHLIAERDWFAYSADLQVEKEDLAALPYTTPGSLSYRAFSWLNRKWAWWRVVFWPQLGHALLTLALALFLTLILSVILGQRVILITIAALAVTVLALLRAHRHGASSSSLQAILEMGFAWLAGHVAFAPLTLWSFVLAGFYTIAYHSCLKLAQNSAGRWLLLLKASQATVIAILVFLREPVIAGVVALMLLPQMLLQPFLNQGAVELWYLRRTYPFLMAGTLLAALAVR